MSAVPIKSFRSKPHTVSQSDAEIIGKALDAIRLENDGQFSIDLVVQYAKKKSNPLHRFFEWEPTKQIEAYLTERAKWIVRSIEIVYEAGPSEEVSVRAFVNVGEGEERSYVGRNEAITKHGPELLQRATSELRSWIFRWMDLESLNPLRGAIEKALEVFDKRDLKKAS